MIEVRLQMNDYSGTWKSYGATTFDGLNLGRYETPALLARPQPKHCKAEMQENSEKRASQ